MDEIKFSIVEALSELASGLGILIQDVTNHRENYVQLHISLFVRRIRCALLLLYKTDFPKFGKAIAKDKEIGDTWQKLIDDLISIKKSLDDILDGRLDEELKTAAKNAWSGQKIVECNICMEQKSIVDICCSGNICFECFWNTYAISSNRFRKSFARCPFCRREYELRTIE